jgi:2-methylisocitrate lyase-like PEP mutase family enzyme
LERMALYERAGADGIFVPFVLEAEAIARLVKASSLPLNVLLLPGLPTYEELQNLGVRRLSMGGGLHRRTFQHLQEILEKIRENRSFQNLFEG